MPDPFTKVIASGNLRESLEAIRDRLADELAVAQGREVAPIAKELRAVVEAINAIPGAREGSVSDDLEAQRRKRRSNQATG